MIRRVVWSIVAALALAVLGAAWFVQNFHEVPFERWEAPQREARSNPYLALERLLAALGRPVTRIQTRAGLTELPPGGVLLLDGDRRRHVDAALAARLLAWVEHGGYLIVAGESAGDDPLLARLGVGPYHPPRPTRREVDRKVDPEADSEDGEEGAGSGDAGEGSADEATRDPAVPAKRPPWIGVRLPDADIAYRYRRLARRLSATGTTPLWYAGAAADRAALLHFAHGAGHVTVLDGLDAFTNYRIGHYDHAELLWALLARYQPQGEIRLASRLTVPSLWTWLAESAPTALTSALVLLAIWLVRIVPRFGGAVALPAGERRDLAQHLAAIGRSVWREGGVGHWMAVVRQAVATRLALRHPQLMRQEPAARLAALGRLADCPPEQVSSALVAGQAATPETFTAAMQTLQRLDQRL